MTSKRAPNTAPPARTMNALNKPTQCEQCLTQAASLVRYDSPKTENGPTQGLQRLHEKNASKAQRQRLCRSRSRRYVRRVNKTARCMRWHGLQATDWLAGGGHRVANVLCGMTTRLVRCSRAIIHCPQPCDDED